jgi:hypothetical protein
MNTHSSRPFLRRSARLGACLPLLWACGSAPTPEDGAAGSPVGPSTGGEVSQGGASAAGGAGALGGANVGGSAALGGADPGSAGADATGGSAAAGNNAGGGSSPGGASAAGSSSAGTSAGGAAGSSSADYTCTLMMGILATEEWYDFGFESIVDNAKWELEYVHSGFVELWADPKDPVWSTKASSLCAQNADKPDRIVFLALNFDFNTLDQWLPPVTAVVKNLRDKYPSARRIELMSFIRAPGNMACSQAPAKRSTITPAQDQALAMVAAANPGLVVVAPKFEAKSCSEFSSNPPHPSPAGVSAWVKLMGNYYR